MNEKTIIATVICVIVFVVLAICLFGCANAPDPAVVQQYADTAHQIVGNGISDYKQIKPLTK